VTLTVLVVVYAAMTAGAAATIISMSRRWANGEKDLATPYGPSAELGIAEVPVAEVPGVEVGTGEPER
jgi:hypothetical protein